VKGVVPLAKARDDAVFGSKAVGLGQAAREGLPLPPGVALSGDIVEAVAGGEERAIKKVVKSVQPLRGPLAVRSSAVDEDGAEAICLGCAGMGPLDKAVERALGVPVLDGVACAVKLLEGLVDYDLTTSRVAAFKAPEQKEHVPR
jgi:hypothetical protein